MVIGHTQASAETAARGGSAWEQVEAVQRNLTAQCLLVPQPAHAALAGDIAAALLPTAFGVLPPPVLEAIRMHDTGWSMSDAQQIQRLRPDSGKGKPASAKQDAGREGTPVSFVTISPREAIAAWTASIKAAEALSNLGGILVSRHFTLLAPDDAAHAEFRKAENARRAPLEQSSGASPDDLDRWTAALGFCDLLSLYLVSGIAGDAQFPLAHPASPAAKDAPQVTLQREGARVRFMPTVLQPGSVLELQALIHPAPHSGPRAELLHWEFV